MSATAVLRARASVQPAVGKPQKQLSGQRSSGSAVNVTLLFHVVWLAVYGYVWTWHFSPRAQVLPGATGFGWFFRYLTFFAFTLQLAQLLLCVIAGAAREGKTKARLSCWADDFSCSLFGLAHAVTLMYYIIHHATKDVVEGGVVERPPWLGFAVHVMNTIFAWSDLLVASPRSFSKRSGRCSTIIILVYCTWILVCREMNGFFPYPFLNKMPFPTGFIGVVAGAIVVFSLAFQAGKGISSVLARCK